MKFQYKNLAIILICFCSIVSLSMGQPTSALTIRPQTLLSGLAAPIFVTHAKDGSKRLFIVQQRGIIKVLQPGASAPSDFMSLVGKVSPSGSEQGLLGLAFHPQFATNGYFFVNYTRISDAATVIARYKAINGNTIGDPASEAIILTIPQPFSNHNGGMIEFGQDGHLYIGMGDGGSGNDPGNRSQNINDLLGKMLRITPSLAAVPPVPAYTVPSDNPYVGVAGADEIYAVGLRNPWRWSFDRGGTNQLWAGDVGQNAIEEVDIITRGGNYGWRVYEGNTCTNLDPTLCTPANFAAPVLEYNHTGGRCSITGGYVYRGRQGNLPGGAYVYADYCTGEIWMRNGTAITPLLGTGNGLLSSFGEDEDGEHYIIRYSSTNGLLTKLVRAKTNADFDGDFKTDYNVFRPSNGVWYNTASSNAAFSATQFGASGDIPAPEDFDGDNISDIAVFRPSNGVWYALRSSNNTFTSDQFGANGDIPAQADFDGDAKADRAVFRPSVGTWFITNSGNSSLTANQFGANGDKPVTVDFDADGKADIAVFRESSGTWFSLNSSNGQFRANQFGATGDIPVPGDYDADGRSDLAVYRAGVWYIQRSSNLAFSSTIFGLAGDIPVVGDYDGDGRDDIAVWRGSAGAWYRLNSGNGAFAAFTFGASGDLPAPAYDAP